jgi:large subunit ribosomal protein L23
MALFGRKKQQEKTPVQKAEQKVDKRQVSQFGKQKLLSVLLHPRITEKATMASEAGVYVFDILPSATKSQVAEAISLQYKVKPKKVNIVTVPRKKINIRMRGRFGVTSGGKKAYVYLKEGDRIEIV